MAEKKEALVAVVCDGAGSAQEAAVGAELAAKAFVREVKKLVSNRKSLKGVGPTHAHQVLEHVHKILNLHSTVTGTRLAELSCTVVGAVVDKEHAIFMQVGDGAAVFEDEGAFQVAVWPDAGEYVNETVFVTDPKFGKRLLCKKVNRPVSAVVLFSDGLQFLVLDYKKMEPHTPFFQSLTKALGNQAPGVSDLVSNWLGQAVLGSTMVTSKTDDDLSLVVAVRRDEDA